MKQTIKIMAAGAMALTLFGALSTTADASHQKRVYNVEMSSRTLSRNYHVTGKYALYSYPKTIDAKAKTVASTKTMAKVAKAGTSFRAYQELLTSGGYVYYKVVSFDTKYRGYMYAGRVNRAITKGTGVADLKGGLRRITVLHDAALPANTTVYFKPDTTDGVLNAPINVQYNAQRIVTDIKPFADDALTVIRAAKNTNGQLFYAFTSTDKQLTNRFTKANPDLTEAWVAADAVTTTPTAHNVANVQFKIKGQDAVIATGALQTKGVTTGQTVQASDIVAGNIMAPYGYALDKAANAAQTPTAKYDANDRLTVYVTANEATDNQAGYISAGPKGGNWGDNLPLFLTGAKKANGSYAHIMAKINKDPFFFQPSFKQYTAAELFKHLKAAGATDFYKQGEYGDKKFYHYVLTINDISDGLFHQTTWAEYARTIAARR